MHRHEPFLQSPSSDGSRTVSAAQQRRVISWRSVLLGLIGAVSICAITPYNDYVLANTYVVGNNLPLGAIFYFFLIAVAVNGPLSRFAPRHALSAGELGVAFAMVLVSCSIPSAGLMRYFPGSLVLPFWLAQSDAGTLELLESLDLPAWLYPSFTGDGPAEWMNDPLVRGFAIRWTDAGTSPYTAWVRPALTWGVYFFGLFGAIACMIVLVRRQWYENERLSFPLAQIQLALLDPPRPGHWFSELLENRSFWYCFAAIFLFRAWNGLGAYFPGGFPQIPTEFNMTGLFGDPPWSYLDHWGVKYSYLYLTVVGISFFLQGSVGFSLWFTFALLQLARVTQGTLTNDPAMPGLPDQKFGAMLAYLGTIAWIGRRHWRLVLGQAFRGEREGEPVGRYMSYRAAFWGLVACAGLMSGWMVATGSDVWGSVAVTVTLLLGFLLVARIVAETGLLQVDVALDLLKPWQYLQWAGWGQPVSVRTMFMASHLNLLHHDPREIASVYGMHATRVLDETAYADATAHRREERRLGRRLILLLVVTMAIAYATGLLSMLRTEYVYAVTNREDAETVNAYVESAAIPERLLGPTATYAEQRYRPLHNVWAHLGGGAVVTLALSALRLRFAWWQLHPVGYLCVTMWPVHVFALSIFTGWLLRSVSLRFGGAKLYGQVKVWMLGLIVGDAAAGAFWLLLGIGLSALGLEYRPVMFMPD